MKKRFIALAGLGLAAVTVAASGAVFADKAGGHGHGKNRAAMVDGMFEQVDANKDGFIDAAEIEAARAARFGAMDTNGDGVISLEEMQAAAAARAEQRAERRFAKLDANGDGTVDPEEMNAKRDRRGGNMLEKMDKDGDGRISKDEAAAMKMHHHRGHGARAAD